MSFYNDNQNYIKMRLQSDLRNKTAIDREKLYLRDHQLEIRSRIIKSLRKELTFSEKCSDYFDLFTLLAEYEFQFLCLCIYFDSDAEKLFSELRTTIKEKTPSNFKDEYLFHLLVNTIPQINAGIIPGFLKSVFSDKLNSPSVVLEVKENNRNDFFNGVISWLEKKSKTTGTEQEILFLLLHFCKMWQLYYTAPYNHSKGIVFLHGMINLFNKDLSERKIDLDKLLNDLQILLDGIPYIIIPPPFLDSMEVASVRQNSMTGYVKKLAEFHSVRKESNKLFKVHSGSRFLELFEEYLSSNNNVKETIANTIVERLLQGDLPASEELAMLEEQAFLSRFSNISDPKSLRKTVLRMCYAFDNVRLKVK